MISHEFKTLFIHVPKTAGQSMEQVFIDSSGYTWETREHLVLGFNPHPTMGPDRLSHLLAREYAGLGYVSQEQFDSYFKFSFVRNPWDRMVSQYYYRRSEKPFDVFVEEAFADLDDRTDFSRHIIPQSDYLYDEDGRMLIDFVGRYENIEADFDKVMERVGLANKKLPRMNVSGMRGWRRLFGKEKPRPPFQDHYTPALRDRVGEFYRADIENFDYAFEPPSTQES